MTKITRENVEELLDKGKLQIAMRNGNHWTIRRNGQTRRWKRTPARIYIPFKMGLRLTGAITESDFYGSGELSNHFRVNPSDWSSKDTGAFEHGDM